jgi:uncharacterized membrane protein YkoI
VKRWAVLVAVLCTGCAAKEAETTVVPLAEVSPDLINVAQKTLPNVKFKSARKIQVDGEDVYEIRGTMANGKVREVEVSASGKVIEVE